MTSLTESPNNNFHVDVRVSSDDTSESITCEDPNAIYSQKLYDMYLVYYDIYADMSADGAADGSGRLNFKGMRYRRLMHPYDNLSVKITSKVVSGEPEITNAFMKMYEMLLHLDQQKLLMKSSNIKLSQDSPVVKLSRDSPTESLMNHLNNVVNGGASGKQFKMFDIASAPGMFVIATSKYLEKYYPDVSFEWHATSLVGGTALEDQYGLFKENPSRFTPCDILNESDVNKIIKVHGNKYQMVTGDIGTVTPMDAIQEPLMLNLQWSQAMAAVKLCATGGICYLKMFTLLTYQSAWLVTVLTKYFDSVRIVKPLTSRLFNVESYLLCIGRNTLSADSLSTILSVPTAIPRNVFLSVHHFEKNHLKYRQYISDMILNELSKNDINGVNEMINKSTRYRKYFKGLKWLINVFKNVGTQVIH